MAYTINGRMAVNCADAQGWNMSLLGKPKLTIRCGKCLSTWKTRDYSPLAHKGKQIGMYDVCPSCTTPNILDLIYE